MYLDHGPNWFIRLQKIIENLDAFWNIGKLSCLIEVHKVQIELMLGHTPLQRGSLEPE